MIQQHMLLPEHEAFYHSVREKYGFEAVDDSLKIGEEKIVGKIKSWYLLKELVGDVTMFSDAEDGPAALKVYWSNLDANHDTRETWYAGKNIPSTNTAFPICRYLVENLIHEKTEYGIENFGLHIPKAGKRKEYLGVAEPQGIIQISKYHNAINDDPQLLRTAAVQYRIKHGMKNHRDYTVERALVKSERIQDTVKRLATDTDVHARFILNEADLLSQIHPDYEEMQQTLLHYGFINEGSHLAANVIETKDGLKVTEALLADVQINRINRIISSTIVDQLNQYILNS